jgi:hypothetical protein
MKKFLTLLIILTMACLPLLHGVASAAVNYNNLIDDAVFDNSGTMNAQQINDWLNAKFPSSCISTNNGFTAPLPSGYNPSQGYLYGANTTAGKIISDVATIYGMNPQVLISTLEKESSVVSGSASYHCQYMSTAMGYDCPDSGNCPRNPATESGFSKQVVHAAWILSYARHRSEGQNNWYAGVGRSGWDNTDDLGYCYSGPTVAGGPFYLCPDQLGHTNDPLISHSGQYVYDSTQVQIQTGATAALFNYTPHLHGQQLFTQIFNNWFGSQYSHCTYPTDSTGAVFREFNPNTNSYFLTTDPSEVCATTGGIGYTHDGAVFYPGANTTLPVYRLNKNGNYLYTVSTTERNVAVNQYGFRLEGVAFYADGSSSVSNPLPVYRLAYPPTGGYAYTVSSAERDIATSQLGYTYQGVAFYVNNSAGTSLNDIYRLRSATSGYLYTSSPTERDWAQQTYHFVYDGIGFQTRVGFTADNLPVYRLAGNSGYLYTTSFSERKSAMRLGFRAEGIAFYAYPTTNLGAAKQIYRLNNRGVYFYTSSLTEATSAKNSYGYALEGVGFRTP